MPNNDIMPIRPGFSNYPLGLKGRRRPRSAVFQNTAAQPVQPIVPRAPGVAAGPQVTPHINVSPLNQPGVNPIAAAPGQSLASQVSAATPESRILPGGGTMDQSDAREGIRVDAGPVKRQALPDGQVLIESGKDAASKWSIRGGLTPEADQGKAPRVEIPMSPVGDAAPEGQRGVAWKPIAPQAAGIYAQQVRDPQQAEQIRPAPVESDIDKRNRESRQLLAGEEVKKRQAAAGARKTAEARYDQSRTDRAKKYDQSRTDRAEAKALTAKKYDQSRTDRAESKALAAEKAKQSRTVDLAEHDQKQAQAKRDGLRKQLKALEKIGDPESKEELSKIRTQLAEADKRLSKAAGATKAAIGVAPTRAGKIRPAAAGQGKAATVAPAGDEPGVYPSADQPAAVQKAEVARAANVARVEKARAAVESPGAPERATVSETYSFARKKGLATEVYRVGQSADAVMKEALVEYRTVDATGKAVPNYGKATAALFATGKAVPNYGKATAALFDKGIVSLRRAHPLAALGDKNADRIVKKEAVSWMARNMDKYPEAVKAWQKKHPGMWRAYAPIATIEVAPGKLPPRGNGQKITDAVTDAFITFYGADGDAAERAAKEAGWRF